jgi:hypothetical protein
MLPSFERPFPKFPIRSRYHQFPTAAQSLQRPLQALPDLVICPQRVALDAFGHPAVRDEPNAFVKFLWERGTSFERETIAKLDRPFVDLSGYDDEEKEPLTLEALRRGEPLIYSGRMSTDDLIGVPNLLRKEPGAMSREISSRAPEKKGGDDNTEGKPKLHYAVQLALYVDILERLNLSAGRRAFVWTYVVMKFSPTLPPHKARGSRIRYVIAAY